MSGGGSRQQTIGYRYFMGLHFGLVYGPADALLEVRVGDRTAWTGSQAVSGTIFINAPSLFGGEEREGGVQGTLDVMMGEPTQAANSYLTSVQGGSQPGYRGFVGAVWRGGLVSAMNPYIKPWSFRLRRIVSGWRTPVFYSARASISVGGGVQAMNPAHIIYQCLTDPEWGMGYPIGSIDTASFTAAADTFWTEGLGLCLLWSRSEQIERFLQIVCDHAGCVLGVDRRTGLFVLTAIRGGYSIPALPAVNPDNIVSLDSFDRRGLPETVNEVLVKWTDPLTGRDGSFAVHDLANILAQGGVVTQEKAYPGAPTFAIASRMGQRDLQSAAAMLARVRFRVNRTMWALRPGGLCRFSWPPLGIVDMPLRVGRIDYGNLQDGTITVDALEDVFGLPAVSYVAQQPEGWTPPSTTPVAPPAVLTLEAPYREVLRATDPANFAMYTTNDCFVGGLAARPTNTVALSYDFQTRVGAAAYVTRERAPFAVYGLTAGALTRTATSVTLSSATDLGLLTVGMPALIGTEVVRVDNIVGLTLTIARGCLDTVPQAHAAGATFWGFSGLAGGDPTTYVNGETVTGRYLTLTSGGLLAEGSAPVASVTTSRRFGRPYPPGDLQINALRYPATIVGAVTASWTHRDRVLQADTVLDTLAASIGPEAGTTYTVEWYDETNMLRRTHSGLTGTSQDWSTEIADSGLGRLNNSVRVRVWAVRAGLDSFQRYDYTFAR